MIARIWHGTVPAEKSKAYHRYVTSTGIKDYKKIKGNKGAYLLKHDEGELTHFLTLTFWSDIEAIKRFAGNDFQKAKYYPEDKDYLTRQEAMVTHYEILESTSFEEPDSQSENFRARLFFHRPYLFYK